jgi:hypothetical protein
MGRHHARAPFPGPCPADLCAQEYGHTGGHRPLIKVGDRVECVDLIGYRGTVTEVNATLGIVWVRCDDGCMIPHLMRTENVTSLSWLAATDKETDQ